MKTFKLISLKVLEPKERKKEIPLIDGLIIDQEDDNHRWIIEAFIDGTFREYFQSLRAKEEILVEVKITKESNDPAIFTTKISRLQEIDERMNVLFIGKIVDERKSKFEQKLVELIDAGYEGKELLEQFKHFKEN